MLNIDQRAQDRIQSLFNPLHIDSLRSRHEHFAVELRSKDRYQRYAQRRLIRLKDETEDKKTVKGVPTRSELMSLIPLLNSDSQGNRVNALRMIHHMATNDLSSCMQDVLELGIVEKVAEMCRREMEEARKEAYWALCNLASTCVTKEVVRWGGIDVFWLGLKGADKDIIELSILGLGNICTESPHLRDQFLSLDLHCLLTNLLGNTLSSQVPLLRAGIWTLSKLIYGEPRVSMQVCQQILPTLCAVLDHNDEEIVVESLCALVEICGSSEEQRIQAILNTGFVHYMLVHLVNKGATMRPALKLVGKMLLGTVTQVQTLVNLGVLGGLEAVLTGKEAKLSQEALWCLSNIAACSEKLARTVLTHSVFGKAMEEMSSPHADVRLETSWLISNLALVGKDPACIRLVNCGILDVLPASFQDKDPRLVFNMLDVCEALLQAGARESEHSGRMENTLATVMMDGEAYALLERLAGCRNAKIAGKAEAILRHHFSIDMDEDYLAYNQA